MDINSDNESVDSNMTSETLDPILLLDKNDYKGTYNQKIRVATPSSSSTPIPLQCQNTCFSFALPSDKIPSLHCSVLHSNALHLIMGFYRKTLIFLNLLFSFFIYSGPPDPEERAILNDVYTFSRESSVISNRLEIESGIYSCQLFWPILL